MMKDYYNVLGIDLNAAPDQIKSAYRQKVKRLHPDRYGPDSGPFLAVQEAYEVLSDPARRRSYDNQLAHERWYQNAVRGMRPEPLWSKRCPVEPLIPTEKPTHVGEAMFNRPYQAFHSPLDKAFERLWSDFGGLTWPQVLPVEDIHVDVPLSPNQVLSGGRVRLWIQAPTSCPSCQGQGGVAFFQCWHCYGRGIVTEGYPVLIAFPAGLPDNYTVSMSLGQVGIRDTYLTVRFKVNEQ